MANINLSWTNPSTGGTPAKYKVFRGASGTNAATLAAGSVLAEVNHPTNTYTDSSASAGTTYAYTVVANNSAGDGSPATAAEATA
tara:strand:- start:191 stop:445 length:255 start_codon:yes stop_codon:yes gene_type:complete